MCSSLSNIFLLLAWLVVFAAARPARRTAVLITDYDVVLVGGGPSGLSALSSLSRVERKAILLDSGVYRNAPTRHMHDVIGDDGLIPAVFRAEARAMILKYPTASIQNTTVVTIDSINNGTSFVVTDVEGRTFTSRKVILGTGLLDVLPETPGVAEAFGKGMYWCPWCDGFEHRDQPLGILGPLSNVIGSTLETINLNHDVIILANGTDTPDQTAILDATNPTWRQQLTVLDIPIDNRSIESITRLQDGAVVHDQAQDAEYDIFRVNFANGESIQRSAFFTNYPTRQNSDLGYQLGLNFDGTMIAVDTSLLTSAPGVYAVGDANSDGSTNIPHAMWSGKRAGVYAHGEQSRPPRIKVWLADYLPSATRSRRRCCTDQ